MVADVEQLAPAGQFAPVAAASEKSVPVPVSETLCGLPGALSVMLTLAARFPVAVGVNVTLIAQSPLLAPVMAMLAMVNGAVPLFVSVTLCAALVVVIS